MAWTPLVVAWPVSAAGVSVALAVVAAGAVVVATAVVAAGAVVAAAVVAAVVVAGAVVAVLSPQATRARLSRLVASMPLVIDFTEKFMMFLVLLTWYQKSQIQNLPISQNKSDQSSGAVQKDFQAIW
jgi:hypothetical protein